MSQTATIPVDSGSDRSGSDSDPAPETVRFPTARGRKTAPAPTPTEAASLAAIERRLSELVRVARLGLAVGAAWMLWQVFGGGIAWVVSAATWVAVGFAVLLAATGVAAYLSPWFRKRLFGGVRALFAKAAGGSAGGR